MIHYQLCCQRSHAFDGWFASSAGFDGQVARGLVECPFCGDTGVRRALMTPSVPRKGRSRAMRPAVGGDAPATAEPGPVGVAGPPAVAAGAGPGDPEGKLPDTIRAALQRIRANIESHCEYVGRDFAAEARRIHSGESTVRGIYGEATPEQAEALADEGVEVSRLPWLPRADG